MANPVLYLIDGTGLSYRAYYALSGLSTSYGQPTGAVFGFINILNKVLKDNPEYVVCCFDVSRETFRQKKYKEYKMHRPEMPGELRSQMQLIRETAISYNIMISELEGYEADDLIATFARKAKENLLRVVVVSEDKDILQLVDNKVKVFSPQKDKAGLLYDEAQVKHRFGVAPSQIVDYLSLTGDVADNIAGVKGIGEKTARKLISEFGNVDNLIVHLEEIKSGAGREALRKGVSQIRLNQDILRLCDNIDIDFDLNKLRRKEPDYDALYALFKKLEFNSLLRKLPFATGKVSAACLEDTAERLEDKPQIREKALKAIAKDRELLFILDTQWDGRIYVSSDKAVYSLDVYYKEVLSALAQPDIEKISHDLKEARSIFLQNNISLEGALFDTMIAAYLLDSSLPSFDLSELAYKYLQQRYTAEKMRPEDKLRVVTQLAPFFKEKLKEDSQEKLFYDLEMPLTSVLANMQAHGVKIDAEVLSVLSKELEKRLIDLRGEIYRLNGGEEFNLNSPKQLAGVLFEKLKLAPVKKTKTGFSTDEEVLRKLSKAHKLPLLILDYRNIAKLKSTYVDSLPALISPRDNRIHTIFNQAGTETGRLSSHSPNLQNIPAKGDIAALIRKSFVAENGYYLVCADYSQIELRVLAHFSGDEALICAFGKDLDIHRHSASLIFQTDEPSVTGQMRETAKRINFGIIYGMGSFSLAKDLDISAGQAQAFIEEYFLRYPKVKRYIEMQVESARKSGYVETILGRRRYLAGINSKNEALRAFAERQAVNSPIQGSSADLIKLAMVNIHKILEERRLNSKLIMQIHDELALEVLEEELEEVIDLVRDKMEGAYRLAVPLKVNIKKGKNWLEMESV
jgi:DNA polymerase-1